MKNNKEPKRAYNKPDNEMFEHAQGIHDHAVEKQADFQEEFPFVDAEYLDDYQTEINTGKGKETDTDVTNDLQMQTSKVEEKMSDGRGVASSVYRYIGLAYPDNEKMLIVFGHKEYAEYSKIPTKFPGLLRKIHEKCLVPAYKTALMEKGLKQITIDKLLSTSLAIEEENKKQYTGQSGRVVITQDRIEQYNKIWGIDVVICNCAKEVYKDDWANRHLFLLYPEGDPTAVPPIPPVPPIIEE